MLCPVRAAANDRPAAQGGPRVPRGSPPVDDATAGPVGYLETGTHASGINLVHDRVCEAEEVGIEFTHGETGVIQTYPAAYGTIREDTAEVCGDTDNGYGLSWNWNRLGDGVHTVRALVDGEELGVATVTTLGEEFAQGQSRTEALADFPEVGQTVTVAWQPNIQNFVITRVE